MALKRHVVTTKEAATILDMSPSTIKRWVETGRLKGFRGRVTIASIEDILGEPIQWPDAEADPEANHD